VIPRVLSADVIGIDEGQFFADIVPFCEMMAQMGKTVVVACLDGDFTRSPFGSVLNVRGGDNASSYIYIAILERFSIVADTKRHPFHFFIFSPSFFPFNLSPPAWRLHAGALLACAACRVDCQAECRVPGLPWRGVVFDAHWR
jgi:hypothetical protein